LPRGGLHLRPAPGHMEKTMLLVCRFCGHEVKIKQRVEVAYLECSICGRPWFVVASDPRPEFHESADHFSIGLFPYHAAKMRYRGGHDAA